MNVTTSSANLILLPVSNTCVSMVYDEFMSLYKLSHSLLTHTKCTDTPHTSHTCYALTKPQLCNKRCV